MKHQNCNRVNLKSRENRVKDRMPNGMTEKYANNILQVMRAQVGLIERQSRLSEII